MESSNVRTAVSRLLRTLYRSLPNRIRDWWKLETFDMSLQTKRDSIYCEWDFFQRDTALERVQEDFDLTLPLSQVRTYDIDARVTVHDDRAVRISGALSDRSIDREHTRARVCVCASLFLSLSLSWCTKSLYRPIDRSADCADAW